MSDIPLTSIQTKIAKIGEVHGGYGRHCTRSAVLYLKRGWKLRNVDREIAAFCAITAEEEAASALFYALRRRKYAGAKKLDSNNHDQKAAVAPFFRAVAEAMAPLERLSPQIEINEKGSPPLIRTRLTVGERDGKKLYAYPEPPLNFSFYLNSLEHDFSREVAGMLSKTKVGSFKKYAQEKGRIRSQLLYATAQGIPRLQGNIEKWLFSKVSG